MAFGSVVVCGGLTMQQQEVFDPYRKWLGIAPKDQPPNFYRLLGIDLFEGDVDVIANAADQRMTHVRTFQSGPHGPLSQRILNELAAARVCLLDPQKRAEYDAELREKIRSEQTAVARAAPPRPVGKRWREEAEETPTNNAPVPIQRPIPAIADSGVRDTVTVAPAAARKTTGARRQRSGPQTLPILLGIGTVGAVAIGALMFMLSRDPADANSLSVKTKELGNTASTPPAITPKPAPKPVSPVEVPKPAPAVHPLRIQAIGNQTVQAGKSLQFQVSLETQDQLPRPLRFSLRSAPDGATIDERGMFRFVAPQSNQEQTWNVEVQVALADNAAQKSSAQFQLRLVPDATSPGIVPPGSSQPPQETPVVRRPWTKEPVPPAQDVDVQVKLLLLQYGPEYAKATPEERLTMASKLRTEALSIDDHVRRYALLTLLGQVALAQRDLNGVWQAIQFIEMRFEVDGTSWRAEALEKLTDPAGGPQAARNVAQKYYELLARAQSSGSAIAALKVLEPAEAAARLAGDENLRQSIVTAGGNLRELARLEEEANQAHQILQQDPGNAEAKFIWGRYLYLVRNDFAQGLPLLAQGDNRLYRQMATAESAVPKDAAGRKQVGDLWWEIQQNEVPALRQRAMRRVMNWYNQARSGLDAAGLAEINSRNPEIMDVLTGRKVSPEIAKLDPPKPEPPKPEPPKVEPPKPAPEKPPVKPGPSQPESKPLEGSALTKFVRAVLERGGRIRLNGDKDWIRKPEQLPAGDNLTVVGLVLEKNVADDVAVQSIRRIHSLTELTLDSNRISSADIHRLSDLKQLTRVEITSSRMSDSGIPAFAEMHDLSRAAFRGTQLRGANLDTLAGLTKLRSLEVAGDRIVDATLIAVSKLEGLDGLSLQGGNYSYKAVGHLQSLTNLTGLTLKAHTVNDQVIAQVAGLKSLQRLSLEGPIQGGTLSELAKLEKLESLTLVSSLLDEKDIGALSQLKSLERLSLKTQPLNNGTLDTLSTLTRLKSLDIQTAGGFNEAGLKHLDKLPDLRRVHLAGLKIELEAYLRYKKDHPNVDLSPVPDWQDKLKEWGDKWKDRKGPPFGPRRPPGR